MRKISVFNIKTIHTKSELFWGSFVAPYSSVRKWKIISMGIENSYNTVKTTVRCLLETVHSIEDIDIDTTVFVKQIRDVLLISDVLGKPSQRDFHVFKTRHWFVQEIIFYVGAK